MITLTIIYNFRAVRDTETSQEPSRHAQVWFGLVSIRWSIDNIQPDFMFGVFMVKFINVLQANKNQFYQVWGSHDAILMNVY